VRAISVERSRRLPRVGPRPATAPEIAVRAIADIEVQAGERRCVEQ